MTWISIIWMHMKPRYKFITIWLKRPEILILQKLNEAKSQVIEVSAAMVCGLVILLALISLS